MKRIQAWTEWLEEGSLSSTYVSILNIQNLRTIGECVFVSCACSTHLHTPSFYNPKAVCRKHVSLCAISTGFLRVVVVQHVGTVAVGLRPLRLLSGYCHSNHFQPSLLKLLRFCSKVVDGLGLGKAEACRRVCGSGAVIHRITHQRDAALGLHILREKGQTSLREQRQKKQFVVKLLLLILPVGLRRGRAPNIPSQGWCTKLSARVCSSQSTAGSRTWCCYLWTDRPQSAKQTRSEISTETPAEDVLFIECRTSPQECPSSFPQLPLLP